MQSNSRNKIAEEIANFTDAEIFRAFFMSIKKCDYDLTSAIMDHLSDEKRKQFQSNFLIMYSKIMAIQGVLLAKASMAVAFYNTTGAVLLQVDQDREGVDGQYIKDRQEEIDYFKQVIEKCDEVSKGATKLDYIDEALENAPFFDYWKWLLTQADPQIRKGLEVFRKAKKST